MLFCTIGKEKEIESGKQKSNSAQGDLKAPAADALCAGKPIMLIRTAAITDADLLLGVSLLLFKEKGPDFFLHTQNHSEREEQPL